MIHYRDKTVEHEEIVINGTDSAYLGPALTLKNCTIILSTSERALTVKDTEFIECDLVARRKLSRVRWDGARFSRCRFKGTFSENDFGPWLELGFAASLEDCDLSGALLDGCRVLGASARSNRFPAWPCFTIFDPVRRLRALSAATWPQGFEIAVASFEMYPPNTGAVTFNSQVLAKQQKVAPEDLRAALDCIEDVFI